MEASLELPLGDAAATFSLETAVCSHGLYMMAPNRWDPLSKTLLRPLHLTLHPHHHHHHQQWDPPGSVMARISQPHDRPHCLRIRIKTPTSLTPGNEAALLAQVSRMLRLSESEDRAYREFREVYGRGSFSVERVFRSPTLFEDMVKCILLCNCQWPRTLSMAQALCELQQELLLQSVTSKAVDFVPKTPAGKEPMRNVGKSKACECLATQFDAQTETELESHPDDMSTDKSQPPALNLSPSSLVSVPMENNSCEESYRVDSDSLCDPRFLRDSDFDGIGNFPTPTELAKLDKDFLSKRCKLGYRAGRILKLAQGIVEGRIQLRELEVTCMDRSLSSYNKLAVQLRQIDGFGPFTCANVLMCMGFYHVIPSDSETVRHLQQVHGRNSTIRTIERDVQQIYAKYAPFQFLAYWSELWHFYEKKFGKTSEMPSSAYKLFTASNMKTESRHPNKRKKTA